MPDTTVLVYAPKRPPVEFPSSATAQDVRAYFRVDTGFLCDSEGLVVQTLSNGRGPYTFSIDPKLMPCTCGKCAGLKLQGAFRGLIWTLCGAG